MLLMCDYNAFVPMSHVVIPIVGNITRPSDTLLDQPVAIFCLASGYPLPTVTWQQDGNNVVSNGSGLGRIDILIFRPSDADDILEEDSSADIEFLIMVYMDMITSLGELGVVSMLSVDSVIRGESGNYTCTATNQLPQTRTITTTSSPVPLLVLGKWICHSTDVISHPTYMCSPFHRTT